MAKTSRLDCAAARAIDVLDEIAPAGTGEAHVRALIARLTPRHAAAVATYRGLNRMHGVTGEALLAEADAWARAARNLSPQSLAMMRRLSRAQARLFGSQQEVAQCP